MPWRLQARSNFFSVSVCVCPLFLWEIVNLSLLDIYSWRNRRRRASIVSQWFLVLPCHVSTDWSSAVECPKMPKVNACRAKTQLMICYKFISKDLLNRLKKSGVDSVDSFRCHWIHSCERRCLGSLMKPCTESGSSGSTGDMSQMNIHESENNFAGHLRPPTDEWRNDERIWTHMNASSLHFPMNTRRSFEAHNLSEAFARPWPFQLLFLLLKVHESSTVFRCPLNILNLKVLQKRCLNLLGSRGAGCALVFRRLDCSGCVQFCALNLPGWSCLTWQEIDIWTMDYIKAF